jgi:hypothetical protein
MAVSWFTAGKRLTTTSAKRSATQNVSVRNASAFDANFSVEIARHDAKGNEPSRWFCVAHARNKFFREVVMTADRRPLPDDLNALKEIISGRPADAQTMQRLITCNLIEDLDGTALLTSSGIEAAALLAPTK